LRIFRAYLLLTAFVSGMTTLGVELSASRLLDPFFGNSMVVWASIIGLMLLYLTVGYYAGGRWADQDPRPSTLFQITAWGAFLVGLVPFVSRPVLRWSVEGMAGFNIGLLAGSFIGVIILFSFPITLLGTVSPFVIRLSLEDVEHGGNTAGSVYAVSTLGSLLGTFLPVLVLIPWLGTRLTFFVLSVLLLGVSLVGLVLSRRRLAMYYVIMLVILVVLNWLLAGSPVKATPGLVYETESAYNYIQVIELTDPDGGRWHALQLNEGQGIHSLYNPNFYEFPLVDGVWDYFLVAPYFNAPPYNPDQVERVLIIGSAAGTISKAYSAIYGPITIDGVEIDPEIIRVGREWFDMTEPNLTSYAQDGRYFLANTGHTYDVIGVDAYRPPYIPFHLTTHEFFQEGYDHLTEDGVMVINAGRTATDYSLVRALGSTMKSVFPNVYVIDVPSYGSSLGNSLVVATKQPTQLEYFAGNAVLLQDPFLQRVVDRSLNSGVWELEDSDIVFTDDKAPVEQVIHQLIVSYILGN
jgi:predicted membrane-bound spermidine synthase